MDCNELVEVITDYLEDTLVPTDRARFEQHLLECPYCVTYLGQMRSTLSALGRIPVESVSDAAQERLLSVFRDWKKNV